MGNNDRPTSPQKAARETKLAQALRDNLKRRKALARGTAAAKPGREPAS